VRATADQPDSGVAGQIPRSSQVDLAVLKQHVDVVDGRLDLVHPGPAGDDDVLGVVFVGRQTHRGGLDPQRNVLAHQRDSSPLRRQVGGTGQDPRVIVLGAEPRGQHRGVAVVELNVQRTALCPNGNRLIKPAVFQPHIIEEAQRLAGEPAELVVVPFGLQLADHH